MKEAIVFWNGYGWAWVSRADHALGERGPHTLDGAIRAAHGAGYNIYDVTRTHGLVPFSEPQRSALKDEK